MKKKIADQWVAALRSGDYKQGKNRLRNVRDEFCCLGVLCNLHAQAHPEIAARQKDPKYYMGETGVLSGEVAVWAGMKSSEGRFYSKKLLTPACDSLTGANDSGVKFPDIADFIEKNYKHL